MHLALLHVVGLLKLIRALETFLEFFVRFVLVELLPSTGTCITGRLKLESCAVAPKRNAIVKVFEEALSSDCASLDFAASCGGRPEGQQRPDMEGGLLCVRGCGGVPVGPAGRPQHHRPGEEPSGAARSQSVLLLTSGPKCIPVLRWPQAKSGLGLYLTCDVVVVEHD